MRNCPESCQSAKHNSYHCDISPALGAAVGLFIIANETALFHQPTKGSFDDPAAAQNLESLDLAQTSDHCDTQFGPLEAHPLGEIRPAVTAVHPEQAARSIFRVFESK